MAKFNFDEIINRKNTYSLKWDFNKERNHDEDELSMWVADMDFKLPDAVINPLIILNITFICHLIISSFQSSLSNS